MEPRCSLERMARAVFDLHTKGAAKPFEPTTSGAEWYDARKSFACEFAMVLGRGSADHLLAAGGFTFEGLLSAMGKR